MDESQEISRSDLSLVLALADFQLALSAVTFMDEADPDKEISRIERRRLRCYEDSAVIAYCRPFCRSRGLKKLTLENLEIEPTDQQKALHNRIRERRDTVVAHTDIDRIRFSFSTFDIDNVKFPYFDFDDGLSFFNDREEFISWLRFLINVVAKLVFNFSQQSKNIKFLKDYKDINRI